ncbi:MAG: hypothetical protein ACRD2I_15595 [Vicinamibacterales bacterium]
MRRTIWLLAVEALAIVAALTLALDLREHGRVAPLGGVNEWGYRGPVTRQRQPHEIRIAIVGGTRAFGWGVPASALVAELGHVVMFTTDRPGEQARPVVVINLGRMGALPEDYPEIIEQFAYLKPDYICLLDDLGVRGGSPVTGTGRTSGIYQLTGYAPALPLVLREKGMILRRGDVRLGYMPAMSGHTADRPLVDRAAGATLEAVGQTLAAADLELSSLVSRHLEAPSSTGPGTYVDAMMAAIDSGHRHARGVVVVTSPPEAAEQAANQSALQNRLIRFTNSASWLRRVNLADDAGLSSDPGLRLDGWNYSSAGVVAVAHRIAPALVSLIQS